MILKFLIAITCSALRTRNNLNLSLGMRGSIPASVLLKTTITDFVKDSFFFYSVFEEFDGRLDNVVTRIEMFHNGRSLWLAPFVFLTSCKIDVSNFPFDEQTCILKFSSWVYSGKKLNLTGMGNKTAFLSDKRVSNGEWEVVSIPVVRQVRFYEALPDVPYPEMIFKIHLKRRSLFYIVNLVIPNFLITLLAFFSFFIPAECGERISFIITVLLSMTVFLLLVAENIPPTSDAVPVISVFFTASIVEVSLALIATGVTLRINYSYLFGKRHLSPKFKRFLFKTLGPTLAVDTSSVIETKEKEDVKQERKAFRDFRKAFRRRRKRSSGEEGELGMNSLSVETAKPNGGSRAVRYIPSMSSSSSEENDDSYCSCSGFFSQEKVNRGATAADVEYRTNELSVIAEGVNVIARVFEDQNNDSKRALECKMAASVVDRAFMCLFVLVFIVSSITIMLLPLTRT